tara:strand:- start:4403 stop:6271 length:1869 start_codon:yes stop_codon:yes gene_type:complete
MNKKSKISKKTWWIFGLVGLIYGLTKEDTIWIYIGLVNGLFWGWILGLLFDYIINSLFYREEIEDISKPTVVQKSKVIVNKPSNHNDYKPKPLEYKTKKETTVVKEPSIAYKPKTNPPKVKQTEKPIKKEKLPFPIKETTREVAHIKYVNYDLKFVESEKDFPIIKIPNKNCVVRSHRIGSTKRRGFKEASFQKAVEYFFAENFKISGNLRLNTGKNTRPFEPDVAIIDSSNENIRIDIEIDEPYAGITRQTTHCIGDDINRDNYFKERGWIVIRFSEYQIHTQEKECLKYIANIISLIKPSFKLPTELNSVDKITKETVWDVVQAQKWEKSKYREQYLNHEFKKLEERTETLKRDFDNQETEEEKLVVSTSFGKEDTGKNISFNNQNKHIKDKRIKFYSEKHIYTIDGVPAPSASTIIGRFFPEFDSIYWSNRKASSLGMTANEVAKMWADKGKKARDKGTFLHEQIENYYLGIDYEETEEFDQFQSFINDHNDLVPYRSEWRVYDDSLNIAGTIDLIVTNGVNHDIYDWKRSKKVVNTFSGQPIEQNQWQQGVGGLSHIDDTSYNRYCLQQSLYKYILDKNYGLTVDNMYLIVMYPENDNYYKVEVPYLKKEIEYILETV